MKILEFILRFTALLILYLGRLLSDRPQKAIEFSLSNYNKVELCVLNTMVQRVTRAEEEEYNEVRSVLKTYLEDKGEDFFKELEFTINNKTYENTTREGFLKSFENDDQLAT